MKTFSVVIIGIFFMASLSGQQKPVQPGPPRKVLRLYFKFKPPRSHVFEQVALMAAEERREYFS